MNDKKQIQNMRESYDRATLLECNLEKDPIDQFKKWFSEAQSAKMAEPNAMVLSTINEQGYPSSRVVLLKEIEDDGIVFYTNYNSAKGKNIAANPQVSVVFLWKEIQRQVRIEGRANKVSEKQSTRYFQSRPKGSQIGAWVSNQSQETASRAPMEERKVELESKYADVDILPKPPHWGGYKIVIDKIEFWQGRPNRLHDRLVYKSLNDKWIINRLEP